MFLSPGFSVFRIRRGAGDLRHFGPVASRFGMDGLRHGGGGGLRDPPAERGGARSGTLCLRFAKTSFRLDWLYGAMTALEARAPPPPTIA